MLFNSLHKYFLGVSLALLMCQCNSSKLIQVNILQTNDVYEIAPLEGGKTGGMARLAQVKKDLSAQNPNTISVLAGDFLNPSVLGTLSFEGSRIQGKQMIEAMNSAGIDLVTFGNHEFDLKEPDLLKRIDESNFGWIIANASYIKQGTKAPFQQKGQVVPAYHIKEFKNQEGKTFKIGFIGICLNMNQPNYVSFEDPIQSFKEVYESIKNEVDMVIGLTHQNLEEDKALAAAIPEIKLILGGHEHDNVLQLVGNVRITKADANAKSAYIHRVSYNPESKKVKLKSQLKTLNEQIPFEPNTQQIVQKWTKIADEALRKEGINPNEVLITLKEPLDARESFIRNQPSPIGQLIAKAAASAYPEARGAILNVGSIRIDDFLSGQITQYDVARLLPFGGGVILVEMKGSLLLKTIEVGRTLNIGKGGFLEFDNITFDSANKQATIQGQAIDPNQNYKIAMPAFLITGRETNLSFLSRENPEVIQVTEPDASAPGIQKDIRLALIEFLKNNPLK
ncbi:MAG: bifunctional metallophosphatase/5'-nucleotidase [Microscillaceae bacterium]|nr:bifunctional metallophosphatase/5'-nucleotidase [Microscillaceae bacterium]